MVATVKAELDGEQHAGFLVITSLTLVTHLQSSVCREPFRLSGRKIEKGSVACNAMRLLATYWTNRSLPSRSRKMTVSLPRLISRAIIPLFP